MAADLDNKKAKARLLWMWTDPPEALRHLPTVARRMKLIQEADLGGRIVVMSAKLGEISDVQSMEMRAECWRAAGMGRPVDDAPPDLRVFTRDREPVSWRADRERHEQAVRDRFGDVDAKIRAALLRLDA
jgi:hypothetical protein